MGVVSPDPVSAIAGALLAALATLFTGLVKRGNDRDLLVDGIEQRLWERTEKQLSSMEAELHDMRAERDEALAKALAAEERVGELERIVMEQSARIQHLEEVIERRARRRLHPDQGD